MGRREGWSEDETLGRGRRWIIITFITIIIIIIIMTITREGWSEDETMGTRRMERWSARQSRDRLFEEEDFRREEERRRWEADLVREEEGERRLRRLDVDEEEDKEAKDCWGQRNVSKANVNLAKLHQSFGSRKDVRYENDFL